MNAANPAVNPAVNIVTGDPTPEELAALVVALRVVKAAGAPPPPAVRPRRALRRPLVTGPNGWRESRWNLGRSL
ncbi:acyl-CoA carboxylase epsilon subunit [Streptosporangium sp. NPDC051022]|uniref:acyl-CoA carboxylase epsilon subunit n=1 Tax=Streptosporangium sp. NPDC051022 TaxID=3155752 RepID=UPI00343A8E4B